MTRRKSGLSTVDRYLNFILYLLRLILSLGNIKRCDTWMYNVSFVERKW